MTNMRNISFAAAFIFAFAALSGCGGDSGSGSNGTGTALREVQTISDLGPCTEERNGDTVFVTSETINYLCFDNRWLDITTRDPEIPLSSDEILIIPQQDTVKLEIGRGAESAITLKDPLTNLPIANEVITIYYDESTELSLSSEKKHWGNGLSMVSNSKGSIPWVASIKNHGQVKDGMSQKVTFSHSNGSTCTVDIYYYEKN